MKVTSKIKVILKCAIPKYKKLRSGKLFYKIKACKEVIVRTSLVVGDKFLDFTVDLRTPVA